MFFDNFYWYTLGRTLIFNRRDSIRIETAHSTISSLLHYEQKDIAELSKLTFFGAVHMKNHIFDADHRQKTEEYLQTEVRISLQEETLDMW